MQFSNKFQITYNIRNYLNYSSQTHSSCIFAYKAMPIIPNFDEFI